MIKSCDKCGGLYVTENLECFAGTPCACATPSVSQAQWLPIESAPKTGERILLGHGNSVWEDEWFSPEQRWWNLSDDEVPTHWMPKPPPPTESHYMRTLTVAEMEVIEREAKPGNEVK